jgi:TonB-dependent starch-binding outer membrane protein SusC
VRKLFVLSLALPLAAALGLSLPAQAQQTREITGKVTQAGTDAPIPDVQVGMQGQPLGTRTNVNGEFRLRVPAGEVTLLVRYIGFKRQTRAVPANQNTADFALEKDVLSLEQVVVTGQATTIEKRNAATAVAVVTAEEVTRAPAPSIESALQGKILGANISMNTGQPGGGGQIQIRGATSILGSGEPLFVVDGVVVSNAGNSIGTNSVTRAGGTIGGTQDGVVNRLADLNPNEIESIEVLKSAGASAIYGARATNGVVVIRTKRGTAGAVRTNFSGKVGTQSPLRLVHQRRFTDVEQAVSNATDVGVTEAFVRSLWANGTPPHNDFQKQLYDNSAPSYEGQLSVNGGSEQTTYYASASHKVEEGIARNTNSKLQSMLINLDQQFGSKLRGHIGANILRHLNRRGISNNDNSGTSPMYIFGYTPAYFALDRRDSTGQYVKNPFNGTSTSNPFQTFELLKADEDTYRQIANFTLNYAVFSTALHNLNVNFVAGMDRYQQDGQVFSPGILHFEPNDGLIGEAVQSNVNTRNLNSTVNAIWSYTPGGALLSGATLAAGLDFAEQGQNVFRQRGRGLLPGVGVPPAGGQTQLEQTKTLFRDQAMYVNTDLRLLSERMTVSAGVRGDRSSANGDREKWFAYPRISASYVMDDPVRFVDNFKLRAAYGKTGNRPRYGDRDITLGQGSIIEGRPTLQPAGVIGNPLIEPEKLTEIEYGFDAALLDQRLSLEATYYDRTIRDFLLQAAVAPTSGVTNLIVNAGELATDGYEAAVTVVPILSRNLNWTSRITYQSSEQELSNLPAFVPPFAAPNSFGASFGRNFVRAGSKLTAIWGNAPVEVDGTGRALRVLPKGAWVTMPGVNKVSRDTIIGDANPDFQMYFTNQLQYKRFEFRFLLDWRKGGDVANMTRLLFDEGGQSRDYDEPSPVDTLTRGQYQYAAWRGGTDARMYVEDGSYVKLREVSLVFDVPTTVFRGLSGDRIGSMRLQLLGRNLVSWTDYWGADAEFNNFGNQNLNRFIDLAPYPPAKQFFFGIELGF